VKGIKTKTTTNLPKGVSRKVFSRTKMAYKKVITEKTNTKMIKQMGMVRNPETQNPDRQNPDTRNPEIQNPDRSKIPTGQNPENTFYL
jgi:hypothetical protein